MRQTRRAVLSAAGAGTLSLAGCLGGFGGGGAVANCDAAVEDTVESMPAPALGDPDSSVTVAVFEDFACPHCATFSLDVFPRLRERFVDAGKVRYEHHDFPIPVSQQWSWATASAARAVQDTTDDETFFAYAKACYRNQDSYSMDLLADLADEVGAAGCAAEAAARRGSYRPVAEADRQRGVDSGVRGTPTVFVNGRPTRTPSFDDVAAAIRSARQ